MNQQNVDLAIEDFAAGDQVHGFALNPLGFDEYRQILGMFLAAFPDAHVSLEDMVAEGDTVVVRLRFAGHSAVSFRVFHRRATRYQYRALRSFASKLTRSKKGGSLWIISACSSNSVLSPHWIRPVHNVGTCPQTALTGSSASAGLLSCSEYLAAGDTNRHGYQILRLHALG